MLICVYNPSTSILSCSGCISSIIFLQMSNCHEHFPFIWYRIIMILIKSIIIHRCAEKDILDEIFDGIIDDSLGPLCHQPISTHTFLLCATLHWCLKYAEHHQWLWHQYFLNMHDRDTRLSRSNDVHIPPHNSAILKRSFMYNGSVVWNNLSEELKALHCLSDFKKAYKMCS